jgi:lysophospholipase L1-like esterase
VWVAWGAYLWADGLNARSDGLTWQIGDFAADGTHPSTSGRMKVAKMLLGFLESADTSRCWFRAAMGCLLEARATLLP